MLNVKYGEDIYCAIHLIFIIIEFMYKNICSRYPCSGEYFKYILINFVTNKLCLNQFLIVSFLRVYYMYLCKLCEEEDMDHFSTNN